MASVEEEKLMDETSKILVSVDKEKLNEICPEMHATKKNGKKVKIMANFANVVNDNFAILANIAWLWNKA